MATEACGKEGQVKLLGSSRSPFVLRVRIALALKGIHYQFIEENIENKSELLLQSNPVHKKIPVLIHNGKPVCESMVIVQYIGEAWDTKAPNLMPKDPSDRAIARFWAAFVDDKLVPSFQEVSKGQGEQLHKAVEESVANFLLLEEALRTSSRSGKAYFGGDEIGLVDISLGRVLELITFVEKVSNVVLIDPEKMPLLNAWSTDRFCEADGVKEVMPDQTKLLEYISSVRAGFTSPPSANILRHIK